MPARLRPLLPPAGDDAVGRDAYHGPLLKDVQAAAPAARPGAGNLAVVSIAAAGAALLVYQWAGGIPLWLDEEMLALNVRERSLAELAGPLWLAQAAPAGWLAVERVVLLMAGSGEVALRVLPLLFGLGTLATAAWIGVRWLGPWGGSVLALLCAFGPWLSYHAVEVKPYSADAFWALLLPALVAWVLEPGRSPDGGRIARRAAAWWAAAVVAHWFATAALMVTPACGLVLHAVLWRRHGWRVSARAALPAFAWAASFGLHYAVSLRHALGSGYLQSYWRFALPPDGAGVAGTFEWLASRFHPLAVKPIGTGHSLLLWVLAAAGVAAAARTRPAAAVLLAAVPLSAFAWAGLRLVPMFERLSLWIVPAVFVAIGAAVTGLAALGRRGLAVRRPFALAVSLAGILAASVVSADIVRQGFILLTTPPRDNNHDVDDRGAVRWLMARARPGDVVLTTHLALPAVWWYGGLPVPADPPATGEGGAHLPLFEAQPAAGYPRCQPPLAEQLGRPGRVLVYLGFRFDDWPDHYDDVLFARLAEAGAVEAYRTFEGASVAMIVDLSRPPAPHEIPAARPGVRGAPPASEGCVDVRPAQAW